MILVGSMMVRGVREIPWDEPAEATAVREVLYATTQDGLGQSAMVTDGRWKYVYSEANATEELYDQVNDLGELCNQAGAPAQAGRLAEMRDLPKGIDQRSACRHPDCTGPGETTLTVIP